MLVAGTRACPRSPWDGRHIEEKPLKLVADMTIYGQDEREHHGVLLIDVGDGGVAVLGAGAMEVARFP
jgi:hypothetical protein